MNLYIGITDDRWYEYLSTRTPPPDEVNFWRPKSQDQFRVLSSGELFLFKLHAPHHFIVGGGVFTRHTFLPIWLAWDTFLEKNGTPDYKTFAERIIGYRGLERVHQPLGCTVLTQPFFWPRELWLPVPVDWPKKLWDDVQARIQATTPQVFEGEADHSQARYGDPYLIKPRLGQGAFRVEVTHAYSRRCAITGEQTLPALAACHIRPYADSGPHEVSNGLLLRSDLHNLFDLGYLTVTLDYKVMVSRRIKEEYQNGRHYYALDNQALAMVPTPEEARPRKEFLEWHRGSVFKG